MTPGNLITQKKALLLYNITPAQLDSWIKRGDIKIIKKLEYDHVFQLMDKRKIEKLLLSRKRQDGQAPENITRKRDKKNQKREQSKNNHNSVTAALVAVVLCVVVLSVFVFLG